MPFKVSTILAAAACTLVSAATLNPAQAATETILYSFGPYPDGVNPASGLVAVGSKLYGTTYHGGAPPNLGTIFSFDLKTQKESVLHSFAGAGDGGNPVAGLTLIGNVLYGSTTTGGLAGFGTIFSFEPASATETPLFSFSAGTATSGVTMTAAAGVLYGVTPGPEKCLVGKPGCGTVFSFSPQSGAFHALYVFDGVHGASPQAPLLYVNNALYGTTTAGGSGNQGTVFMIDPNTGVETVLHDFSGVDGQFPLGQLITVRGNLVGTTKFGGLGNGSIFSLNLSSGGVEALHFFGLNDPHDGLWPTSGITELGGVLYGTTFYGGYTNPDCEEGCGIVYALPQKSQNYQVEWYFDYANLNDGWLPLSGLKATKGTLYGTTLDGGSSGWGTIYEIAP